jgi:hypothetical protein
MKTFAILLSLLSLLAGCATTEQPANSSDQNKGRVERPTPRPNSPMY